jgi:hypothetical protein
MKKIDITISPPYTEETTKLIEDAFLDKVRMIRMGLQPERLHQHIDGAKEYRFVCAAGENIKDTINDLPKDISPDYGTTIITICVNQREIISTQDIQYLLTYAEDTIDNHLIEWNMAIHEDQEENIKINILLINKNK